MEYARIEANSEMRCGSDIFVNWLDANDYLPKNIESDTRTIIIGILSRDALVVERYTESRIKQLTSNG